MDHEDVIWAFDRLEEVEKVNFPVTADSVDALLEFAGISKETWDLVAERSSKIVGGGDKNAVASILGFLVAGMATSRGTQE